MFVKSVEKKERSLGTKLFLKAYRCSTPKCVMIRRPAKPGSHKRKKGQRAVSEFGHQLQEKQKVQFSYGLNNRQMRRIFGGKKRKSEDILALLESRLDNIVFRLGLADSRRIARQLVNHGHFLVNGRKNTISSYSVKIGDKIGLRPHSLPLKIFANLAQKLKKIEYPVWLKMEPETLTGELTALPLETQAVFDLNVVAEYYSR